MALLLAGLARADGGPFDYQVTPVRDGIWLLQRPDPTRQPVEGNITVIEGREALMVVDTGGTLISGTNAIALIRGLSDKPVRWVVNTHWHGDHHLGNSAFRAAWPGVQIIAQVNTARDMTGEAMNYLEGQDDQIQASLEALDEILETGVDRAGNALSDEERQRFQVLRDDLPELLRGFREIELVAANRTFIQSLVLDLGTRRVRIFHPGRGNTEGDAVVYLPNDRVLVTGDLVVSPTPYGFHSYPREWIESLAVLRALDWEVLIPGHGDPLRDTAYLDTLSVLITSMRAQAAAAVAAGQDLQAFREGLDVTAFEQQVAGDDPRLKRLFQAWWVEPFSKSAWLEASGLPIIQGDDN